MATVPGAPTNLVATYAGSGAVSISFTPGSNGGSAITNYLYSIDCGASFDPFDPVDTTSPVVISGLTNGVGYCIELKAENSVGEGQAGDSVSYTPYGPADAPTDLTWTNTLNGTISLSFVEASNGGSAITNYEYSLDGGSTFAAFNPPQTTSPVSISGLTNNTQYSIVLRAVNDAPQSLSSATLNIFYPGSGSFNNSGTFSNNGTFNTAGTIYNTLSIYNSVTITNDASGIIYNVGPTGEIINSTLINNYGDINNTGTFSNLVTATINNTNTFSNTLSLFNIGSFNNDVSGILYNVGLSGEIFNSLIIENDGTIDNTGTFSNEVGATINNNGGGFLYTYDSGLLTNDGDINNAGIISTSSGGTCGAGTLTNNGTITDIDSGTQNTDCPP
jgi:hypothetical protein